MPNAGTPITTTLGSGHLYQGRFKSFPIQEDDHLLTVCRYVERNALRAGLVARAENWPWSSLSGDALSALPRPTSCSARVRCHVPGVWTEYVNAPQNVAELEAVRRCVNRGNRSGQSAWYVGHRRTAAAVQPGAAAARAGPANAVLPRRERPNLQRAGCSDAASAPLGKCLPATALLTVGNHRRADWSLEREPPEQKATQ